MSDSLQPLWTGDHQAPLSIRFPRQQYWSRLPFHSPGDFPDPGIEPVSPAWQAGSLLLSHQGSPPLFTHLSKMLWKGQKSTDIWKRPGTMPKLVTAVSHLKPMCYLVQRHLFYCRLLWPIYEEGVQLQVNYRKDTVASNHLRETSGTECHAGVFF